RRAHVDPALERARRPVADVGIRARGQAGPRRVRVGDVPAHVAMDRLADGRDRALGADARALALLALARTRAARTMSDTRSSLARRSTDGARFACCRSCVPA